jgi:hypothetical protein
VGIPEIPSLLERPALGIERFERTLSRENPVRADTASSYGGTFKGKQQRRSSKGTSLDIGWKVSCG